jgi:membrane-bound lytic murein transglycosylase B
MTVPLPVSEWRRLGVRTMTGAALPASEEPLSLISGATRRFLVGQNYDALLAYNCAHAYALSVALLAERISSKAPVASRARRIPAPRPPARKQP